MNNEYRKELLRVYGKPLSETQLPDGFEWAYIKDVYAVVTRSWIGVRVGNVQFRCGADGDTISNAMAGLNLHPKQWDLVVNLYGTLHKVFDQEKNK
ncbi:TPA: hypothetical protein U2I12_000712 [Citrobacter farmeri]|uniref:hypothetical protein n=1 Tax=Citrobacter farmeri TaxID=67824 RepID=UPI000F66C811|nr:hypothetical protein [Citrobacter farmeri]RSB18602.1 hypothetical protein EGK65_02550 [Citrobacter farmeri]HEM6628070.1 hypothetical protein [Citrobacter farmeri]